MNQMNQCTQKKFLSYRKVYCVYHATSQYDKRVCFKALYIDSCTFPWAYIYVYVSLASIICERDFPLQFS